eukprot:240057_1
MSASWIERVAHQTKSKYRSWNIKSREIINIEESLWYAADYDTVGDDRGIFMVEYSMKTQTTQFVKCSNNITRTTLSLCEYDSIIYIVCPDAGNIISFNPSNKQFNELLKIPVIKIDPLYMFCILIKDKIHIFCSSENKKHLIYSITSNQIEIVNNTITSSKIQNVNAIHYNKRIIKFGGYNCNPYKCVNKLVISSEIKDNDYTNIEWSQPAHWQLPLSMMRCGYITYNNFLIIFGGMTDNCDLLNDIFSLDLDNVNHDWIKLDHIKCPLRSGYLSVLDEQNKIHLFSEGYANEYNIDTSIYQLVRHHSMPISTVLDINNKNHKLKDKKRKINDIYNDDNDTNHKRRKINVNNHQQQIQEKDNEILKLKNIIEKLKNKSKPPNSSQQLQSSKHIKKDRNKINMNNKHIKSQSQYKPSRPSITSPANVYIMKRNKYTVNSQQIHKKKAGMDVSY